MRNKVSVLFIIAGLILCLSGCRPSGQKGPADLSVLENAKTVYDVTSFMTITENDPKYSECKNDKDLLFYFDLLGRDEYIKVSHKGKDYILLWYTYYSYGDYIKKIKNIGKSFRGSEVSIEAEVEKADLASDGPGGCFPTGSRFKLILSLDQDVNLVYLTGKPLKIFSGGHVRIGEREAIVDKDLNFIVPPVYDGIYDLEPLGDKSCPKYYRVHKKGAGNGVIDNNYKPVLNTCYGNVYYINENKFIVGTSNRDATLDEILLVDRNDSTIKKIKGFLCAGDQGNLHNAEGHIQICDPSYGNLWGYGIVDWDLNTVIEPVYQKIYWHETYYSVEDYDGQTANFDINGKKIT